MMEAGLTEKLQDHSENRARLRHHVAMAPGGCLWLHVPKFLSSLLCPEISGVLPSVDFKGLSHILFFFCIA